MITLYKATQAPRGHGVCAYIFLDLLPQNRVMWSESYLATPPSPAPCGARNYFYTWLTEADQT